MKTKTKGKRIFAFFITIAVIFTLFSSAMSAQEITVDVWDGGADTSWYDEAETEFVIETAEEFAGLAVIVNGGENLAGKTILLASDLDLSGNEWVPIGSGNNAANYFGGTFDGQGHRIYNVTSVESPIYAGVFGCVSEGGIVKNLGVIDACFENPNYTSMGILAGWANDAEIINCYTTGVIESSHEDGGFHLVGGLIGQCTAGTRIIGCYSTAAVNSLNLGDDSDTVGGLIGQWENATEEALISDCWFDGKIVCEYYDSGVGGILGANFDFDDDQPGVMIKNCFVSTLDIECAAPGNITWIAAVVNSSVSNCYWPEVSEGETQYAAVVKLVVDWELGVAEADPNFDETVCGDSVVDFTSEELLVSLRENAEEGVEWTMGINNPVFDWDELNISADYSAVEEALAKAPFDLSIYMDETVAVLNAAVNNVVEGKSQAEQSEVDAMAAAVNAAVEALEYKPADYSRVDEAVSQAESLDKSDYKDFSAVEEAVAAVVRGKNITEQDIVDGYADAIENAIASLERIPDVSENPGTGDGNFSFWVFSLIVSGLGIAFLIASLYFYKGKAKNRL